MPPERDTGREYALTASGWDSLGYLNFARFLRGVGSGSEEHALLERQGIVASIASGTPDRSLFNSVLYEHPQALEEHYEEISDAYERAGVRAWCVWVPETDRATARLLEARGHVLDGLPRMMCIDLELVPDEGPELEIAEGFDWETLCEINDAAYGYAVGTHAAGMGPGCGAALRTYGVRWRGFDAAVAASLDNGTDCGIYLVATLPEARGNGLCSGLLRKLLVDARERGCRTSTLQASPAGAPVYRRLGYRDLGGVEFRERRTPA